MNGEEQEQVVEKKYTSFVWQARSIANSMDAGHHSDAEVNYRSPGPALAYSYTLTSAAGQKKKNKFPRFRSKHETKNPVNKAFPELRIALEEIDPEDSDQDVSSDEFGTIRPLMDGQSIVTGRMRKRQVARSKGGEFRSHRQKRRLYCCCISPMIKIQELYNHLAREIFSSKSIWAVSILGDVLILSKARDEKRGHVYESTNDISVPLSGAIDIVHPDNQTVFIFEFGAVVFWGFSNGEERNLLSLFRRFTDPDQLFEGNMFHKGEDDMAFVSSSKRPEVSISNDVIVLPSRSTALPLPGTFSPSHSSAPIDSLSPSVTYELLLSVSYAIAQSAVVSIFEHRIEMKITEYKFIPETLAHGDTIDLSDEQLGRMLGAIFEIKHDLNLHTDILDIPDTLWAANDEYLSLYDRMSRYLEVRSRVEVINKRINMQKEILDMLQQHLHTDHLRGLDTIIIWLLAMEVVIQVFGGGGMLLGFWGHKGDLA
jgi:uncharacterized Rmd1/YagE family protein